MENIISIHAPLATSSCKKARKNSPAVHSEERENQCDETTVSGIYSVSQVITTILNINYCIHFTNEKTEAQKGINSFTKLIYLVDVKAEI